MKYFLNTINFISVLVFAFFCILFQSTLLHQFFGIYKPNLFVILISYLALHRYAVEGGVLSFLIGYLLDLNSGAPFGFYQSAAVLTFYGSVLLSKAIFVHSLLAEMGFVMLTGILFKISFLGISAIYEPVHGILKATLLSLFSMVFLNFLLTPIVFGCVKIGDTFLGKEDPAKLTE